MKDHIGYIYIMKRVKNQPKGKLNSSKMSKRKESPGKYREGRIIMIITTVAIKYHQ